MALTWSAMTRRRLSVFASPTRSSLPRTTCFTLGRIASAPMTRRSYRGKPGRDHGRRTAVGAGSGAQPGPGPGRGAGPRRRLLEPDQAVVKAPPAVDHRGQAGLGIVEQVEVVADQF